jgi:hypothetical protein
MIGYGYDKISGMGDAGVDMGLSGAFGVVVYWYDTSFRLMEWNGKNLWIQMEVASKHAIASQMKILDLLRVLDSILGLSKLSS